MQNVPRNPMVPFVFLYVVWNSQNHVFLYDVTIRGNVEERNLAFGGQKLMYRFEILYSGGGRLVV